MVVVEQLLEMARDEARLQKLLLETVQEGAVFQQLLVQFASLLGVFFLQLAE